jgi:hypothetical protein
MQKLSGLVLDVYDDGGGELMRELYPLRGQVPELVKQANLLTPEEYRSLPDDVFALVLRDGDITLRKFACIDPGSTALSVDYFLKTAHKLPVEAQKLAAENLMTACGWYGLTPSKALAKTAGIGGAVMKGLGAVGGWAKANPMKALGAAMAVPAAMAAGSQIKSNLQGVNQQESQSGFGNISRSYL